MQCSNDVMTAQVPAAYAGYGGSSMQGMGHLGALGAMGYVAGLNDLAAALTKEERQARAAAAQAERVAKQAEAQAKHAENVAARAARAGNAPVTQQARQAAQQAKQAAAQAKRVQAQATHASQQAAAKAARVQRQADQTAKRAALKQKRLLGKTISVTPGKSEQAVDRMTGPITDAANSIQTAQGAARKALVSRNPADKVSAIKAAQTAASKMYAIGMTSAPPAGMRGMRGLGIDLTQLDQFGNPVDAGIPTTGQIDPATGLPYNPYAQSPTASGPYGFPPVPPIDLFGGASQTGLFPGQPFAANQIPLACQKNPNKPVCMTLIMQQSEQQQMQQVFGILQNMFSQLMDLVNQLLAQQFATQAGQQYQQQLQPPYNPYDPYGSGGMSPYGGDPYAGGYGSPYAPGGSVSQIPPGYEMDGDPYAAGGGDPAAAAAYANMGPQQPSANFGPYGQASGGAPQFPGQAASNIISSDSLPIGADAQGDEYAEGDASMIAPPMQYAASPSYGLPPPPQYQQQPAVRFIPTEAQMQQMQWAAQQGSASINQGPGAQMIQASAGPVFAQQQPVYYENNMPMLFSEQPSQTFPSGVLDTAPDGTPQYSMESLFTKLQLPGAGGDELVIGSEGGADGF